MKYWLVKSEPSEFSIDDFLTRRQKTEPWNGIRNYQARNFMRDEMKVGHKVFIYHSNCADIGVVGVAQVVKEAYPDQLALDKKSKYFDEKSQKGNIRWVAVDLKLIKKFKRVISLNELREHKPLANMKLLQKGNRLSVLPLSAKEFHYIEKLAEL